MNDRIAETTTQPPTMSSASADGAISVWLIEDNHTFRTTIARLLGQVPGLHCAHHFSNSEDALETLAGGAVPDVVLVDVELPGMNGIQAVRRIKSMSPATRIIMLTVFDDHDKIFKAICAGVSNHSSRAQRPVFIATAVDPYTSVA